MTMRLPRFVTAFLATLIALPASDAISATPELPTEPDERSGFQPFAPGDVFVSATVLNDPDDDHAGHGRILQYDADLNLKGVMWVDGTTHLVNGLEFAPDGTLWAFDLWAWLTVRFAPNGQQLPNRRFIERPLAGVHFADDGSLLMTEAIIGENQPLPLTTRYRVLPGESTVLGNGNIYRFDRDGTLLKEYDPDVHGGMVGSFGVSHSVWSVDRRSLIYVSETGSRVMRYDVVDGRQLPDIPRETVPPPHMHFDLVAMTSGRLLISMGNRLDLITEDGDELRTFALDGFGWSLVGVSPGEEFAYVGNWFTGEVAKLNLTDGEVETTTNVCNKCMASLAVFGGGQSSSEGEGDE